MTLSEEDRLKKVKIFKETVEEHVIKHMKAADKLFEALFQNVYYAGSYFDGLKVGSANEFDLNLRLKLPFQTGDVQVSFMKDYSCIAVP